LGLETREVDRETESWREQGPWFVLVLLPLAALAFRRGWLLALTAWVMIAPDPSWALSWADLWAHRDQQAIQALEAGEPARAAKLAQDPMLRGTAAYRSGDYEGSLESFAMAAGADAAYNRGNALAQLGRYEEAIAAYEAALAEEPGLADAEFNRQAITELLRRQQTQQAEGDGAKDDDQQARQNQDDPQENTAAEHGDENQPEEGAGSQPQDAPEAGMGDAGANPEEEEASAPRGSKPDRGEGGQSAASGEGDARDPVSDEGTEGAEATAEPGAEAPPKQVGVDTERADEENGHGVDAQPGSADTDHAPEREAQQVVDQWLRRIPDDPGGLLRRKFLLQYQRLGAQRDPTTEEAW
jgi:Ca-activated chloride channel family protein